MKATLTATIMALVFSLQAQFEPFDQFFYKTIWDKLPAYDSATLWVDSLSPGSLRGAYSINSSTPGIIDTMHYHEFFSGSNIYFHSGKRVGNTHVVVSYYQTANGPVPYTRTSYVFQANGNIKSVYIASFNGMIFEEQALMEIDYRTDNKVQAIHLSGYSGTSYLPIGDYVYYYGTHGLDSVLTSYRFSGRVVEKYQQVYDALGNLTGMEFYEDLGITPGLSPSARYEFKYNGNHIQYVYDYIYFHNDSTYRLVEIFEYGKKKRSSLGLSQPASLNVSVYPNPVSDQLTIEGENLQRYRLLNLSGQQLSEGEINGRLDVSSLKPGPYLLHMSDRDGQTAVEKIIKR